jgi:hypothetical protein
MDSTGSAFDSEIWCDADLLTPRSSGPAASTSRHAAPGLARRARGPAGARGRGPAPEGRGGAGRPTTTRRPRR